MSECIHGLDEELCDICSPRKPDEPPEAVAAPRTRSPRTAPRAPGAARAATMKSPPRVTTSRRPVVEALPDVDLAAMRVHHFTHVSNLEAILADGFLRAGVTPEFDVSSTELRARRLVATVPEGPPLAEYVPFSLSPDARSWNEVRAGAEGPTWSDAARSARVNDFVLLVLPVSALGDDFVVTDGDATAPLTRFGAGFGAGGALVRRAAFSDPDLLGVEILVPGAVDLTAVTLIGVPNDRMRDRVKSLVKDGGGAAPRVSIYPPWFRPSAD
ncbi:MAG: hypothetical protein JWP75_2042 [Frondihabitans sp.]|nr:hypothetical protein [Frondihabitans sp.]